MSDDVTQIRAIKFSPIAPASHTQVISGGPRKGSSKDYGSRSVEAKSPRISLLVPVQSTQRRIRGQKDRNRIKATSEVFLKIAVYLGYSGKQSLFECASQPPGQPIGVNVHCTKHPIREQSLSSQPSQKTQKLSTQMKNHSHASRIPSPDQSPSCHSAECKTPLLHAQHHRLSRYGIEDCLQSRRPKENAYSTPIHV
ncbi:hypothetical protein TNCV_2011011 [Trichonephila clavipes]|nr:hypothetical protein TNCV_2011011 [Trichonephila clavipes]